MTVPVHCTKVGNTKMLIQFKSRLVDSLAPYRYMAGKKERLKSCAYFATSMSYPIAIRMYSENSMKSVIGINTSAKTN